MGWMKLIAALLIVSLLLPLSTSEARSRKPNDCNPSSITAREIRNFHKVDDDLYRGGRPTCTGLAKLEALGIRTFVDLGGAEAAIHPCKAEAAAHGMCFMRFKMSLPKVILIGVSDAQLRKLFAAMKNAPKPMFISCSLGRDRTGMVVALYRVKRREMSFNEARQEAVQYGYRSRYRGLRTTLARYEKPGEIEQLPAPGTKPSRPGTFQFTKGCR